jgi:hypothetical protein
MSSVFAAIATGSSFINFISRNGLRPDFSFTVG